MPYHDYPPMPTIPLWQPLALPISTQFDYVNQIAQAFGLPPSVLPVPNPYTGVLGLHIEGNTGGNRVDAEVYAHDLKGRCAVVVNDRECAQHLLDAGLTVFYRQKSADWNDDEAHQHFDARAYVRKLHAEAPLGAILYVINEPGHADLAKLNTWLLAAVDEATKLGRIILAPSFAPMQPELAEWDVIMPAVRAIVAAGGWIAVHETFYPGHDGVGAIPNYVGRVVAFKKKFNIPRVLVSELAWTFNAYDGWETHLTEDQYADQLEIAVKLYAANGIYATIFTFFQWQKNFAIRNKSILKGRLMVINQENPVVPSVTSVPPVITPPVVYPEGTFAADKVVLQTQLRLRATPGLTGKFLRFLSKGEQVVVYGQPVVPLKDPGGSYDWVRVKTSRDEAGWAATETDSGQSFGLVKPPFTIHAPFRNPVISQHFNHPESFPNAPQRLQLHEGADFIDGNVKLYQADPMIHACAAGTVIEVAFDAPGYGNYVKISHGDNWYTVYGHMAWVKVKVGEKVADWDILGLMGTTGHSTGPHCHLTVQHIGAGLSNYVYPDVVDPESVMLK